MEEELSTVDKLSYIEFIPDHDVPWIMRIIRYEDENVGVKLEINTEAYPNIYSDEIARAVGKLLVQEDFIYNLFKEYHENNKEWKTSDE